jgi:uncharacterized repeat protein (TIGR03803 family)
MTVHALIGSANIALTDRPHRSANRWNRSQSRQGRRLLIGGWMIWLALAVTIPAIGQFSSLQLNSFCQPHELGANAFSPLTRGLDGMLYGTTQAGAGTVRGTIFRLHPDGSGFVVLRRFTGSAGDGADPHAGLILGSDGLLYGTTAAGGHAGQGIVFSINPGTGAFQLLHSFAATDAGGAQPYAGLMEGTDGALYGTTQFGGQHNQGVVFTLQKDGSEYASLHHFVAGPANGSQPTAALTEGIDATLFGTTYFGGHTNRGTVFTLRKDGTGFNLLHSFAGAQGDGAYPYASLVRGVDGTLYGTTSQGGQHGHGTIFRLEPANQNLEVLHSFGQDSNDASQPFAALIRSDDGLLYGTTAFGGSNQQGTIFRLHPTGANYEVVYRFSNNLSDGAIPYAALVDAGDGFLFGTTWTGGAAANGTIYSIARNGQNHTVLHHFARGADAIAPYGKLLEGSDQQLHGTTWSGGDRDEGTLFTFNHHGTGLVIQRSLDLAQGDGTHLHAGLIEGTDGVLYGTAVAGGSQNRGVIFAIHKDGGGHRLLRSFVGSGNDGIAPYAALLEASDGLLYGTTAFGGNVDRGTIFRINKNGDGYSVLRRFAGSPNDGTAPYAQLIEASDGFLYGTTARGGSADRGAIFRISRNGGGYSLLRSFASGNGDGEVPYTSLIEGSGGALYGTTQYGGQHGHGTLFKLNKDGAAYSILHHFAGQPDDGSLPSAGAQLTIGLDGALYGTTFTGGTHNQGTVFVIHPDGTGYRVIHNFTALDGTGSNPYAGLTMTSDGTFYGSTQTGGVGCGTLFRILPVANLSIAPGPHLRLSGPAGYRYTIQYLESLGSSTAWQTLTNITLVDTTSEFADPASGTTDSRFYRGLLAPTPDP